MPDTTANHTALHCEKCSQTWIETVQLPMLVDAFVARMKSWSICPKCGHKPNSRSKHRIMLLTGERYEAAMKEHRP